jgi:hypothetical protein
MACPSGTGVTNICTTVTAFLYKIGIAFNVFISRIMNLAERRTKVFSDCRIEILHIAVSKSCCIVKRSDISVLIRPFVHHKNMKVAAVHIELVNRLSYRKIDGGTRIGKDHNAFFVKNIRAHYSRNHISDPNSLTGRNEMDTEIWIGMLLHIFTLDVSASFKNLSVLIRHERCGIKLEHIYLLIN